MKILIPIILLALLTACAEPECAQDSDCITPPEFTMQSNCPFGSICDQGECKVVCPLLITKEGYNQKVSCNKDSDCDCEERIHSKDCICHKDGCMSVEG